jgi:hypothetical protein
MHRPEGIACEWRGNFDNREGNALHAVAFGRPILQDCWNAQLQRHSLGWVSAREGDQLVGFVYVLWDGGVTRSSSDTIVAANVHRQGIGRRLIAIAVSRARAARCEWLHVNFEDNLRDFYFDACGFTPTNRGLIVRA